MAARDGIDGELIRKEVRKHYGELAMKQGGSSCCGPADQTDTAADCCSPTRDTTGLIYEDPGVNDLPVEVRSLSAGCGDPVTLAELKPGQTVLDLGSGGGIDCFLAAQKVGSGGFVIGVDMTPEMLTQARANKHKLGIDNVEFRLGEIEHLPVPDESVDVIISNCVINLSPDKPQVFREAFRALRPGGRLAISDIVADGPLPEQLQGDLSAWACCIAGAMDKTDMATELERAGFIDVQIHPQVMDETLIEAIRAELAFEMSEDGSESRSPRIQVNGEWVKLELGGRKPPFSARITARKP